MAVAGKTSIFRVCGEAGAPTDPSLLEGVISERNCILFLRRNFRPCSPPSSDTNFPRGLWCRERTNARTKTRTKDITYIYVYIERHIKQTNGCIYANKKDTRDTRTETKTQE